MLGSAQSRAWTDKCPALVPGRPGHGPRALTGHMDEVPEGPQAPGSALHRSQASLLGRIGEQGVLSVGSRAVGHGDTGRGCCQMDRRTPTCHQEACEVLVLERMGSPKPMPDTSLMQARGGRELGVAILAGQGLGTGVHEQDTPVGPWSQRTGLPGLWGAGGYSAGTGLGASLLTSPLVWRAADGLGPGDQLLWPEREELGPSRQAQLHRGGKWDEGILSTNSF